jgi:ATP-dependent Clp protease adaptor protein ClpS
MAETTLQTKTRTDADTRTQRPWLWNVVLLDDDHHTYEYVIEMMQKLFGHSFQSAFEIAKRVDLDGRAVCKTTHREVAELKLEQIVGYGSDPRMSESVGPMSALIEPAQAPAD